MSPLKELDRLIRRLDSGLISQVEFVDALWQNASGPAGWAGQEEVLDPLSRHPDERVRDGARSVREFLCKRKAQVKDIGRIRRTSPLQPGTRLALSGGYISAFRSPLWLNGRRSIPATFIDFVQRGADKMPGAWVQLNNEIGLPGVKGRHALLILMYVADWVERETVTVYVADVPPEEIATFASAPPVDTEVESHATYSIETGPSGPGLERPKQLHPLS